MTLQLRDTDISWRDIQDEIVVLDERDAIYLAVSGAGALLWRLLSAPIDREDLIGALVDSYGIDRARASEDLDEFLATLADRDLLAR